MSNQAWLNKDLVYLQKAVLCANCDVISEGCNGHCAACGSQALLNLSRLLGGSIQQEVDLIVRAQALASEQFVPRLGFSAAA